MRYRELAKRLRDLGCEYVRPGAGSHRIWWNPALDRYTTIPDWGHKDIKPGTLRRILRDLGISRREFGPIK
ncbi:MAG: type II toxin-antitoxin system HicA family toxin [Chloroflexi bacterium]|nr:MAG: type II toxin-antitoxin system HicA family toxin [Chloroflexota bacterium]RLC86789.1 MAG: type II toxin-antitoxin system HicA family toxin [Chloroflexota bacterium]